MCVEELNWPAQSHKLNLRENLWDELVETGHRSQHLCLSSAERTVKYPINTLIKLVNKRVKAIKGHVCAKVRVSVILEINCTSHTACLGSSDPLSLLHKFRVTLTHATACVKVCGGWWYFYINLWIIIMFALNTKSLFSVLFNVC